MRDALRFGSCALLALLLGAGHRTARADGNRAAGRGRIVVSTVGELRTALRPENAGARIFVRSGDYALDAPLAVPDGTTLEGEGVLRGDHDGCARGLEGAPTIRPATPTSFSGDVLTLGDGVELRRIAVADDRDGLGNAIGVGTRAPRDSVSVSLFECEVRTSSPPGVGLNGPTGRGLAVLTLNPGLGNDPPPHVDSAVSARIERSVLRATGGSHAIFAANFAARGRVSVTLARSSVSGGMDMATGVSRGDPVDECSLTFFSSQNRYAGSPADFSALQINGGSAAPIGIAGPGSSRNVGRIFSIDDRIEGYLVGIFAAASERYVDFVGLNFDNLVELHLDGTSFQTVGPAEPFPGPPFFPVDLWLDGAETSPGLSAGTGSTLRLFARNVEGSDGGRSLRFNIYANTADFLGESEDDENRLEVEGTPDAFARRNDLNPPPGDEFFTGRRRPTRDQDKSRP